MNPTATYAASKAALNTLSETLRLELAPFGVSVVTILPGVIDSNLHANDAAGFDIPPTSRYVAIRDIIARWANGEAQPKDSLSADKFAELVVDDIVGAGKGGLISRGPYAALLRRIGQWAPNSVGVRFSPHFKLALTPSVRSVLVSNMYWLGLRPESKPGLEGAISEACPGEQLEVE